MDHDKTVSIAFIVELVVSILVAIIAFAEMIAFWGALHSGARYPGSGDDLVVNFSLFVVWLMPFGILAAWAICETVRKNVRIEIIVLNPSIPLGLSLLPVVFIYVNVFLFDPGG